jgi:hypothetical protein
MASPFKVFRKHQKAWLVGLTIMAMFSFVFLGVISELMGTRQAQNPVVVRSKYGKLTQRDMQFMRQDRMRSLGVLQMMLSRSFPPQIGTQIGPYCQQFVENVFGKNTEEHIVNTWLMARRAEEIGMVISNDTINEFLKNFPSAFAHSNPQLLQFFVQNSLTAQDIAAIIKQENLTPEQFFDIVRDELRALEVQNIFQFSLNGITPAQRWDYFCRLRREASVGLIPVEVEQYLAQVKDPSEEELKALFEKYKDKLPSPISPEPGFRTPHKIDVQYFKADFAKFTDPGAITEKEIQDTYEKNRDEFDKLDKESNSSLAPEGKGAAEKEKSADSEKDTAEKEKSPEKEKKDAPAAGEQSKEQPKEPPADKQKPADEPAPQDKPAKEDTKKTSTVERSPFSLTAMADQTETPAAAAPAAEKPKAETPAAAESKAEKPAADQPAEPEKAEKSKPVLSEKMKEKIRTRVAGEKIKAIFLQLQQLMDENGKKWRRYEAEKIQRATASPPPSLDFEALAKEHGLTAGRTGLISIWEAKNFDIGSSMLVEGFTSFPSTAFKSLTTFKSGISVDLQGNGYLFWKINDTPESASSLDDKDVRQQVIRAWKLMKARELAFKEAQRLVEAASKTGVTLEKAFPDLPNIKVITPPPFSMLTEGNVPRGSSPTPPRYSEVEGVPLVGGDFMQTVFNLEINQFGVALNAPQTVVYVVQLLSYSPPQETLWQIFLAEDFAKYSIVAQDDMNVERQAWLESLKTSAGLKWERKPEQQRAGPDSGSLPEEE